MAFGNSYCYQFTQAANLLGKNKESHLEYGIWFFNQIPAQIRRRRALKC